ncbi:acyl-CoA dehydrogenase family protein [Actinomadura bangladeshensis]|uniref:Acyl-CoA dehydrogenase/oxidase C-terminal domain-containing protein n=1 Tax=Actinomadura bangladeshensis TaxID=453573 RepID=A0A6L9QGQ5_9ACTN|nr:hypothetical protein [Actinomadura bangladeshensis]
MLTASAARAFDRGEPGGVEAAMAKYTAFEAASTALDAAMQTLGGNGMSREYGLATLHGAGPPLPDRSGQLGEAAEPHRAQAAVAAEVVLMCVRREAPWSGRRCRVLRGTP